MPVVKLNALNVPTLPAIDGRRTDYRDALLPGLVLRVEPTGRRKWVVEYHDRRGGQRRGRRHLLGRYNAKKLGLAEARDQAREILLAIDQGEYPDPAEAPAPTPAPTLTVAGLVEACLADLRLSPTTRAEWERLLRVEVAPSPIGPRGAAALERGDVRTWARAIKGRSGWTANRAFELLSRAYSWGLGEELVKVSPCDRMPKPFQEHRSERVLSAEELWAIARALARAGRAPWADAVRLLLLTGVRRGAVLGMRREELVGLEGGDPRWVVPAARSKSGRPHVVPLVPAALEVVRRRLELAPGEHLFPGTRIHFTAVETLKQPMEWSWRWRRWLKRRVARALAARRRAGRLDPLPVPRWTLHGLRHAMATHMREELGVAPDVVSLLLGHTIQGPRVTRTYDRAERLGERRAALTAWAAWLEALGGSQAATRVLPFTTGR